MLYLILFIVEILLLETSGFSLTCTNDFVSLMSFHIQEQNCTEFKLTLRKTGETLSDECTFEPCVKGCCCGIKTTFLIFGDKYDAEVFADGKPVHSQTFEVFETFKPQTPNVISVEKVSDIYRIKWNSNVKWTLRNDCCAIVTYQKKGDKPMNSECLKIKTVDDLDIFEIHGRSLEPSTTYVVSVKIYTIFNVSSDSSKEEEFTTDSSQNGVIIAVILSLCVVAIVLSGFFFACFIKLKQKLWDIAAKVEKPKLLDIKPKKEVLLTPESLSIVSLSVEPLAPKCLMLSKESLTDSCGRSGQTSGMMSASSSLDYANTGTDAIEICVLAALKDAFPELALSMDTPESGEPRQNCETTSALLAFDNQSYITQSPKTTYDIETQLNSDSGYHSTENPPTQNIISSHASTIETDLSYQPCPQAEDVFNADDAHNFLPMVYGCQDSESNNVLSEHDSECQSLITGLTNILPTPEMGHFQLGIPQVSNELNVDYGYHSV